MTKHLVLGSSGQVGQYVVEHLKATDQEVIEWDILINPLVHDLRRQRIELMDAMAASDFVHFLAYDVGGSKYLADHQDSFDYIENNMLIMHNTFKALSIMEKPFYFASSQMSSMSHSTYGRLKAVGEAYTHALGGIVVHFWNVFGYETNPEKSHVITDFIKMALKDGKILMRTDGREERNFIYGPDAAKMLCAIPNKYDEIKAYFVAQHVWHSDYFPNNALPITNTGWRSIIEIARIISSLTGNTAIYSNLKGDTIQGVKNEIPAGVHWTMENLHKGKLTTVETGIQDMIDKIKGEMQ